MLRNSFCRFALLLHFAVSALSPHGEYMTYTYCDLASDELLWSIKSVASFVHLALGSRRFSQDWLYERQCLVERNAIPRCTDSEMALPTVL